MIRDTIIDTLQQDLPTGFRVSTEFPWNAQGEPLYTKNKRVVYVSQDQTDTTPLLRVLGGDVMQQRSLVQVYFAVDAKNVPAGAQQLEQQITSLKNLFTDHFRKEVIQNIQYDRDTKIYQFDIDLTTIPQGAQQ